MLSSKDRMKQSRMVTSWLLQMSMPSELYRHRPINFRLEIVTSRQARMLQHQMSGSRRMTPSIVTPRQFVRRMHPPPSPRGNPLASRIPRPRMRMFRAPSACTAPYTTAPPAR